MKPKVSRREKITKHRPKTNETQTKKTIERVNKTKSFFLKKKCRQNRQTCRQIHEEKEKTQIKSEKKEERYN